MNGQIQTTQELLRRKDVLTFSPDRPVSSHSIWSDPVWRLDVVETGYGASGFPLHWRKILPDNSAPNEADLGVLEDLRRLVWIALSDPRLTFIGKPAAAGSVMTGLISLAEFMRAHGLASFEDLLPDQVKVYLEWLTARFVAKEEAKIRKAGQASDGDENQDGDVEGDDNEDVGEHANGDQCHPQVEDGVRKRFGLQRRLYSRIVILEYIWRARRQLARAGVPVPTKDPLSGRSPAALTDLMAAIVDDAIPPVPDEIFLRVVNAAFQMVEIHSEDVMAAQTLWFAETGGLGGRRARTRGKKVLEGFRCSTQGRSSLPWPDRLTGPHRALGGATTPTLGLRNLISSLRDACCLVVLATTGMRVSEFMAARGGWRPDAELPDCITTRRSEDGTMDLFFLSAALVKHRFVPEEGDWLLGSRAAGSNGFPAAVIAIMVLERLMAPWRELSSDGEVAKALGVTFFSSGLPENGHSLTRFTKHRLATSLKGFYSRFVILEDLPDRSTGTRGDDLRPYKKTEGSNISLPQYRKSYAKHVARIDSRLLPALKRQFKHMNIVTTQRSYVGLDSARLPFGNDERVLTGGSRVAEILGVGTRKAGRLADLIDEFNRRAVDERLHGQIEEAALIEISEIIGPLRPGAHGQCGITVAPQFSRCNQIAGSASFLNTHPNLALRSPSVCAGCSLFHVDASNLGFWRREWLENRRIQLAARRRGMEADVEPAGARVRQAAAILKRLGYTRYEERYP